MSAKYLTLEEAAAHMRRSVKGFRSLLVRRRRAGDPIRTYRDGRLLRFKVEDLDASMTVEQPRRLRAEGLATDNQARGRGWKAAS